MRMMLRNSMFGLLCTAVFCSMTYGQGGASGNSTTGNPAEASKMKTGPADKEEVVAPGAVDADAPEAFTETKSGLKYRILRKSEGKKAKASDSVTVHYKGWLDNGKIFDSSYRRGETISFPLSRVIPGWTEGMQLVGEKGMIELEIPYQLGYGETGTPGGPIPPRARLHFLVELMKVGN